MPSLGFRGQTAKNLSARTIVQTFLSPRFCGHFLCNDVLKHLKLGLGVLSTYDLSSLTSENHIRYCLSVRMTSFMQIDADKNYDVIREFPRFNLIIKSLGKIMYKMRKFISVLSQIYCYRIKRTPQSFQTLSHNVYRN